jgi:L-alanine-DL-glutamate epimerase-like enolase superfamily enzyme
VLLSERTAVLALQSGEHGPLAQAIAGVDIALWDLAARRAGEPLWRLLGGQSPQVPVYASGINPDAPEKVAVARRAEGYRAFKLKVGFGAERDCANLRTLRDTLGSEVALMVDANQGWTLEQALEMAPRLEEFGLQWLEEPLRADRPWDEWRRLGQRTRVPLAAGENLIGNDAFDHALHAEALGVVQPDMAKWGGFSGCLPVARRILAGGARYCPHFLGGGIGLLASAHLLAASAAMACSKSMRIRIRCARSRPDRSLSVAAGNGVVVRDARAWSRYRTARPSRNTRSSRGYLTFTQLTSSQPSGRCPTSTFARDAHGAMRR